MKNLKRIIQISLFLFSGTAMYGQKHCLDSIYVKINNDIELNMAIYNYTDLAVTIDKDLKNLQSILKDMRDIPDKTSYSIVYEPDKLLSIDKADPVGRIVWEKEKQTSFQFNNQCNINALNYKLKIQFNEINKLTSDSLIIKIKEVLDSTIIRNRRNSRLFNYSYVDKNLIYNKQLDKNIGRMDVLTLKGGIGFNIIQNQPMLDISAELGLIFNKKGLWKNQYYLSYNQFSDFDANLKIYLNGFLNIGYRYNFTKNTSNDNWVGVELGYLIDKKGHSFRYDTFKLGFNWDVAKYISVSPQLYFSPDFNEFFPALRIGFGL